MAEWRPTHLPMYMLGAYSLHALGMQKGTLKTAVRNEDASRMDLDQTTNVTIPISTLQQMDTVPNPTASSSSQPLSILNGSVPSVLQSFNTESAKVQTFNQIMEFVNKEQLRQMKIDDEQRMQQEHERTIQLKTLKHNQSDRMVELEEKKLNMEEKKLNVALEENHFG